ncbi:MAG: serine/threonine-protein phosphatase [Lachnospiraceae bacterium]|nr:serine/threonine-protein phosphatase [Lachnospiraceae bacterium]
MANTTDQGKKKKEGSLLKAAFRIILTGSIAVILLVTAVVIFVYFFSSLRTYKRETLEAANFAVSLLDEDYLKELFAQTREVYDSIPEEERADCFSEAYIERFLPIFYKQDAYWAAWDILEAGRKETSLDAIGIFFYDEEHDRVVLVLDGDGEDNSYLPGQWIDGKSHGKPLSQRIGWLRSSPWRMDFVYGLLSGWDATNYIDIRGEDSTLIGMVYADISLNTLGREVMIFLAFYIPILLIVVIAFAHAAAHILRRQVIIPIDRLSEKAREYTARDKTEDEEVEPYFADLGLDTGNEIETLWRSLSEMEQDAGATMKRIRTMQNERARLDEDLALAANIQSGSLPHEFPAFPDKTEFSVYATMDPAKEIGGDFYDYFLMDDDHAALIVADVSGKGIPAALFMMISKTVIRSMTQSSMSPRDILLNSNIALSRVNDENMFVTVWLGILTLSTGELVYSSAGHERLGLYRGGTWQLMDGHTGIALGMCDPEEMEELTGRYEIMDEKVTLAPGDAIFQYTDGVTEAMDATEELFSEKRLLEALEAAPDVDPEKLLPFIRGRLNDYVKDAPQFDDITMLGMIYRGTTRQEDESA